MNIIPKWARPGLHTWLGLLIVYACWVHWIVGAIFAGYFVFYEKWEADRIKDKAYRDLAQAMWGIGIGAVVWGIMKWLLL